MVESRLLQMMNALISENILDKDGNERPFEEILAIYNEISVEGVLFHHTDVDSVFKILDGRQLRLT